MKYFNRFRRFFELTLSALAILALFLASPPCTAEKGKNILTVSDSVEIVRKYAGVAKRILEEASADSSGYFRLAELCDRFGPRLSGSSNLFDASRWILEQMHRDGFANVHAEEVMVPHWVRGEESLHMQAPYAKSLSMLGLGGSVSTPPEGIVAEAFVVNSFNELAKRSAEAKGKIVVFDVPYTTYGETVTYRWRGAIDAARAGAVASLVRSVTPLSLNTSHTGSMGYFDSLPKIPHAAITPEDASAMHRLQERGTPVRLHLRMQARTLPDTLSHNLLAEIPGTEFPEEVVVFGGHIDSWDVGQGAHDDAGGCVAAWEALRILSRLGLHARRTIRVVLWTNEENGARGGKAYAEAHAKEVDKHILAIEADAGIFKPRGFGFTGSDAASGVARAIGALLAPIGADTVWRGGGGVDISPLTRLGVPSAGLNVEGSRYFWYHHSPADTVDKIDPRDFSECAAALAVFAYVAADLPERLQREHAK